MIGLTLVRDPRHQEDSRERPPSIEPLQSDVGHTALRGQVGVQRGSTTSSQAVRTTASIAGQRLDESLVFQSADGSVESSRLQPDARKLLNVYSQRITVLLTAGQAGQNKRGRPCVTTQAG